LEVKEKVTVELVYRENTVHREKTIVLDIADPVTALAAAAAQLGVTSLEGHFLFGRALPLPPSIIGSTIRE